MPSIASVGVVPLKKVAEAVRERETFKYEPLLLTDYRFNNTGRRLASSELATSASSVLTALAQLGTYQTGTERALVSLFDASHQYFLAEASPAMPLTPGLRGDKCPTPLSFAGTAIPRSHGICEHSLYIAADQDAGSVELPLSLIRNISEDPRFASKPYCTPESNIKFYASVPIRTQRGINIGVYSVYSSTSMSSWNDTSTRFLRDISVAIMAHLEGNRARHGYRRNERMNRGIGSFIEGKSTLSGWQYGPNASAFKNDAQLEGALDATQQHLENQDQSLDQGLAAQLLSRESLADEPVVSALSAEAEGQADEDTRVHNLPTSTDVSRLHARHSNIAAETDANVSGTGDIFSKAANIVRESFEVAGCLFFDVTMGSYKAPAVTSSTAESDEDAANHISSTSSSDEQSIAASVEAPDALCELLGFSTAGASSINALALNQEEWSLHKRFLAKLLRRYPKGKIFNFDAVGELQSSDSSEDDGNNMTSTDERSCNNESVDGSSTAAKKNQTDKQKNRLKEGALIQKAFPAARSVAFIPVWDSKRERWFAGGFIYTLTPSRIFTIEGELSFFQAFTQLVATEVHNLETMQADQAKSDALGSLSHELRSPLHGIILGTELLNDTDLSVFQGNATHTIEACCRTLLDTIDHLLEYSKINSSAVKRKQETAMTSPKMRKRIRYDNLAKTALHTHVTLDGLVEEVAESMFAGYNFQRKSVRQLSKEGSSRYTDTSAHNRLDTAQAMEQLGPIAGGDGQHQLHFGNVLVLITVDPTCDWMFHMQAGAIRRIVMNLFGNSLKYTAKGTIRISLTQEATATRQRSDRQVKLVVHDTGRGISKDYLRHKLFKPFSQENELAPGTGLGLSLVKTIISQLRGHIVVDSQVGVGTCISVTIPMEPSPKSTELADDDREFAEQQKELKGMRVRLMGFESWGSRQANARSLVEGICRDTLHLHLVSEGQSMHLAPDLVIWSEDSLPPPSEHMAHLAKTPQVVICQDAITTHKRFVMSENAKQSGIFEFVSQPVGPRKLARAVQLAYQRWMGLPKLIQPISHTARMQRPQMPERAHSSCDIQSSRLSSTMQPLGFEPRAEMRADMRQVSPQRSSSPGASPFDEGALLEPNDSKKDMILLVDDNYINLKILSTYMGKLGRSYHAATNGKEAIDAYVRRPDQFVGILMDISMPVMDGLEATRHIRAFESKNQLTAVAILALTGLASDSAYQEALESGVDVFLTKPIRLKALSEVLESRGILPLPVNGQ